MVDFFFLLGGFLRPDAVIYRAFIVVFGLSRIRRFFHSIFGSCSSLSPLFPLFSLYPHGGG